MKAHRHTGYDDDSQYPDDDGFDTCPTCGGEGCIHDCGEDTCCCADAGAADVVPCPACNGTGGAR